MADAAPVLTLMMGMTLTDDVRSRLAAMVPGIELHEVPYFEEHGLRNARASGTVTDAERALAPPLTDDDWEVLERTTVAVLLDVPDGMLDRAQHLRWVQTMSAGTDHLDVAAMEARRITLTTGAGIAAGTIAEFAMGRLLQVWKGFRLLDQHQADQRWEPSFGRQVRGCTLGIVGLGAIGRATARLARGFGMTVLANRRSAATGDTDPDVDELLTTDAIDEMIVRCDAVVISAAAAPETTNLFDRDRIATMRRASVLCNMARGSLVDEDALVDALRSGHLAAAILDTTAIEPTPSDHPLWTAPNCYLSPHVSAGGVDYERGLLELVERNLGHWVKGEPLENVVTSS